MISIGRPSPPPLLNSETLPPYFSCQLLYHELCERHRSPMRHSELHLRTRFNPGTISLHIAYLLHVASSIAKDIVNISGEDGAAHGRVHDQTHHML
ncbi:hypothetical protein P171DRAFT_251822 [Karstenula rhodostoma CBS 690.94]|uniref:Uncharacterized protein n=1 Tax=Karstenula rhodostoma CBS 690.94 TaxID=1392251 RepID=A0A9P4PMX7_9PLEO|nr:hypothetical protein P171DRAFT_251822 [Karstenula rhodostoma CBS 690.94]